jgi:hypothetical protein
VIPDPEAGVVAVAGVAGVVGTVPVADALAVALEVA